MAEVPSDYLKWLSEQSWIDDWPGVAQYIKERMWAIDAELKRTGGEMGDY